MPDTVPTLSFAEVHAADFPSRIGAAFERYGFVIITDHGIPQPLIERFLGLYQRFFALPESEKRRHHVAGGGGARGYTPFGIETAKGATHHDLKEFWHVGRELPEAHPFRRYMPPNVWIDSLPGFRELTLEMFEAFDRMGRRLLAPIARSLALPPDSESVRAGAHEDINVITLLLGAEEPGLQVQTRQGEWLSVNPAPGSLVVNVGDMLQRLTNGVLRSTSHRVINPPRERASHARFSMPYFLHFNPDFLIRSLPQCVGPDRTDQFPVPITADDYLQERLREIKLL